MRQYKRILQILVVLSLALLYAGSRIKMVELGYEVSRVKSEISEMKRENALLRSRVAQGKSADRLSQWAIKLGMTTPGADRVLFLDK
ncbi:MAG: hypothetical protein Q8P84_05340 [Deltaproteobacteria bacterium]|nr:hypothetical protein [Deltaproteobacteria bacterium]MDZ4224552.1 hypothetical protein [bacterium]